MKGSARKLGKCFIFPWSLWLHVSNKVAHGDEHDKDADDDAADDVYDDDIKKNTPQNILFIFFKVTDSCYSKIFWIQGIVF